LSATVNTVPSQFQPELPPSPQVGATRVRTLGRLLLFVGVAVLATIGCGWFVYVQTVEEAIQDLRGNARHRLDLYASSLEREIDKYANFPYVVGFDVSVMGLLSQPGDSALKAQSDLFLEQFNARVGTLAIFLLDGSGRVISSSNWNRPDSFIGRDLSYRPYYREAAVDKVTRFYGIGTTNNEPGYFLATALHRRGQIKGYSVVKVSLEQLERSWSSAESPAILSDAHDVVVLSSVPAWKYATLQPLDAAARREIESAQQYNGHRLEPLGMQVRRVLDVSSRIVFLPALDRSRGNVFNTTGMFLAQTRMMPGTPWRLTVFLDLKKADDLAQTRAAFGALAMAFVFGLMYIFILRHRHLRELLQAREALQRAHDELECKVVERTADLYAANEHLQAEVEERKRAERTLRDAQSGLMQAGKLAVIGQLSAGIAHELNQPLAALMTLSSNAVKFLERGDADGARGNLGRIGPLIERMGRLTGQLKTFVRKSSGEARPVSLQKSIDNALYLLHQRLVKGQVTPEIEGLAADVQGWCDPNRLEQVLVNLIGNALDAMEEQPVRRLKLAVARDEQWVRLEIRDNGPGLSEATLQHIFEPFYTTKAPGVGLGLGLPISAGIVRDFGGELTARNATEGGAIFALTIPADKETRT
jgi:C4-dicarboxylate-specific signal transduction histidine kinase